MRRAWMLIAVAALAGSASGSELDAKKLDALVEDLGELDPAVRARAAKEVRALGKDVVPELMSRLPSDVGSKRWEGILDAAGALDADGAIAEIQSTRSEWGARGWRRSARGKSAPPPPRPGRRAREPEEAPEGERVVDAILARLRTHRASDARRIVPLEAGALWDASYVAPWIAQPVGKKLPEALAAADVPAREDGARLALDLAHDGKFATLVAADAARVVETGSKKAPRRVVVWKRLGQWLAAPASTLTGDVDGTEIQFLDADQDGAFDGDDDLVRCGGGAFRKLGADEHVAASERGLFLFALRRDGAAWVLDVETEPEVSWRIDEQAKEMASLASWRQGVGLAPQRIDRTRSAACRLHHEYWAANGFSGHDESKDKRAYTKEGEQAGHRSSVGTDTSGARFVRDIGWTILHRNSCVGDAGDGVGAWAGAAGSLLWGTRIDMSPRAFPLLVPGPGQTDVPVKCEPEIPVTDKDPQYYATARGVPVAVTWSRLGGRWADLKELKLELFADGEEPAAPGTLWCKERRYHDDFAGGFPEESAIFCADTTLRAATTYVARFRAVGREGPVEVVWQFRTE